MTFGRGRGRLAVMGRPLRSSAGGVVYHVLNRRVMRLPLFEDDADYLAFERVLAEGLERDDAPALFSFCLMPSHWHLLLRPRGDGDLSRWMQWLTVTHSHRWHAHRQTAGTGPVYQGRFKSFPVQTDRHFLTVARYVERNAVRATLCKRAEDWRWSSLGLRRGRVASDMEAELAAGLARWPIKPPPRWLQTVNRPLTADELAAVRRGVERGRPLGGARWVKGIVERLGLESTLRGRGRPRKDAASGDEKSS